MWIRDKDGQGFDGAKIYRLRVPGKRAGGAVLVWQGFDRQTHALIKNMSRASRAYNTDEVQKNVDGSIDVYFGPTAPAGKKPNWVPTIRNAVSVNVPRLWPEEGLLRKKWVLPDVERIFGQ